MKEKLLAEFSKIFGGDGQAELFFSPGRVNLIGEHTDYNGGHVFPCALTIGTYGAVRKREDRKLRLYSMNFSGTGIWETSLDELTPCPEDRWTNYPKGVLWALQEKGYEVPFGFDLLVYGNIPNGSGLSSSASLEVLIGTIAKKFYGLDMLTMEEIAKIGQYSENHYNGVNCGIMDQFAVAMGKKNHAIYLDTATLEYEYAPLELGDARIVIACSNKKRGLADSAYNTRRSECETALQELQQVVKVDTLGDLSEEEFEQYKDAIKDPVRVRRARHAVYENQRTRKAAEALKKGDLAEFGRLMNESHVSLRDDYEVTGIELDTLAETAWEQPGVIGSRMTGAGFGGCTVSIVKNDAIDDFIENVGRKYESVIGYAADFYVVEAGDGARRLSK
ncbi:galactokinase [Lachnospiraceae bacterium CLA-AA-H215]|uniref:Galactokinase n=1 Tax=Hominifimenecus microfluidus TaxID=2885348 RepID=A0AAE3JE80_9FIRM|nr:galactokinase [Hominifimenecus microfluidus]MCC2230739.1 galactokinase [Hominifimenecus microfluidus]